MRFVGFPFGPLILFFFFVWLLLSITLFCILLPITSCHNNILSRTLAKNLLGIVMNFARSSKGLCMSQISELFLAKEMFLTNIICEGLMMDCSLANQ